MSNLTSKINFNERKLKLLIYLITLHTALLVASNAAGAKMIAVPAGLAASATVFSYMATFVVLDVVAELFGKQYSRLVINVGLGALIVSVSFFQLSIAAPAADFWKDQQAYETTLGSSWRILLGGWTSYTVSQYLDVWSFFKIKETDIGKNRLWLRAFGSTTIGQLIDTCIFITIAFYGKFPILPAIAGQYLLKIVLAIFSVPIIYLGVRLGYFLISRDD